MKKKRLIQITAMILLVITLLLPTVIARKGVGIVWSTEEELVEEGVEKCITYRVFNEFEDDVTLGLSVSEELQTIIKNQESEEKFVKAGTYPNSSIPIELCFEVGKVYERECILFGLVCGQLCEGDNFEYSGKVTAIESTEEEKDKAIGSSTSLGVSVPLTLEVSCDLEKRNWTKVYIILIILALISIVTIIIRRHKSSQEQG